MKEGREWTMWTFGRRAFQTGNKKNATAIGNSILGVLEIGKSVSVA